MVFFGAFSILNAVGELCVRMRRTIQIIVLRAAHIVGFMR